MLNLPNRDELKQLRSVGGLIDARKWNKAYMAVDQLRYMRERAKEGCAAAYVTMPATVTSIRQWRTKRALQRVLDHARELP
jgi:hypothetical protein